MKVKRSNVFETNSSAVHSLVYANSGLKPSELPVDKDGYIITDFGDFGDYNVGITAFDQATKLSYLATECYYLNRYNTDIKDSYLWKNICDAICEYANANGVKVIGDVEPSLNHQAIPEYGPKFCRYWDEDSVINFVFNSYVGIKMSHD